MHWNSDTNQRTLIENSGTVFWQIVYICVLVYELKLTLSYSINLNMIHARAYTIFFIKIADVEIKYVWWIISLLLMTNKLKFMSKWLKWSLVHKFCFTLNYYVYESYTIVLPYSKYPIMLSITHEEKSLFFLLIHSAKRMISWCFGFFF